MVKEKFDQRPIFGPQTVTTGDARNSESTTTDYFGLRRRITDKKTDTFKTAAGHHPSGRSRGPKSSRRDNRGPGRRAPGRAAAREEALSSLPRWLSRSRLRTPRNRTVSARRRWRPRRPRGAT